MLEKIMDGRTDLVLDFIEAGNDPNSKDPHGRPIITYCAYFGDVCAIKYLLSKGASLNDLGINFDLNGAVYHGYWQLTQYLLEQGADPNYNNPETGESPLHSCCSNANRPSNILIIQLLLGFGANPDHPTIANKETGSFMRNALTKGETPLHRAAAFCDEESIEMLINSGASKIAKDINGETPLSWASWHSRPGKILSLLTHDTHRIHPLHIEKMQSDHGFGKGGGHYWGTLGKVHL